MLNSHFWVSYTLKVALRNPSTFLVLPAQKVPENKREQPRLSAPANCSFLISLKQVSSEQIHSSLHHLSDWKYSTVGHDQPCSPAQTKLLFFPGSPGGAVAAQLF